MTKMVPASRRVSDASLDPPVNLLRSRAIRPVGPVVAGSASITANSKGPRGAHECCGRLAAVTLGISNHSLRFGWVPRLYPTSSRPSAQLRTGAGTHNPRERFGGDWSFGIVSVHCRQITR